jgi:hypothetical protein
MILMDRAALELLGYTQGWVESGFLSLELLQAQLEQFQSSDDKNTEHYRYRAFWEVRRRGAFSDSEFEQYVLLAGSDVDLAMGRAALIDLLHHPGISEAQWEAVLAHPRVMELPNLIKMERLLRELRRPDANEETLWHCFEEGNSTVQRYLVEMPDLPRPLLEALQERGANKAVRNIARLWLKQQRNQDG